MRVFQEKIDYKVDSKSIVLPWLVRHAAYVLSRFMNRDDGRSAWARLRGKECDSPLAQVGGTVDFKIVRGKTAKLQPRWATGAFLGRTDASDEVIVGTAVRVEFARSFRRRTRDNQWQRDAFTTSTGVPWIPRGLAVEAPMASNRRRYITKSLVQQHGETPGCSACLGVSSQHTTKCRERFERLINPTATDVIPAIPSTVEDPSPAGGAASAEQQHATQPDTSKHVRQTVGMKRGAEDNPSSSSAKRAHTPPLPLSQILPQPDVEMGTVPVPVPEDAVEVNALCEEPVDPPHMEAFYDAASYDHYTGEILDRDATLAGIGGELTQMQEFGVFEWKRKCQKPPNEKVISTKMFHKAKRDEVGSSVVAREYANEVFAPEHHAGTPPTWALNW